MDSPAPQATPNPPPVQTRSLTGKVCLLATASAVASCIGLGIGHLAGLALGIAAVRKMDDSNGALFGYRLALTGCVVGLLGVVWILFGLPPLLRPADEPQYRLSLFVALVCQGELPLFMLLYGLQDRLIPPQCEYGYKFLGPHQERIPMDLVLAAAGSLLGAGLMVATLVGPWAEQLGLGGLGGGGLLVFMSFAALTGRRACRALWFFLVVALAAGAIVLFGGA